MKKIGKLLFILLLCFGFVGCSNNKSVANITEKFEEKNYNVSYNSGDEPTITISESKDGKDVSQFIAYIKDKKVESIAYIKFIQMNFEYLLIDSQNYDDMLIGFIYADEKSDSEVNEDTKTAAVSVLKEFNLTIDDLVDYVSEINVTKGKILTDKS